MENPQFLKKKYGTLHTSPEVQSAAHRTEVRSGDKVSQNPEDQIQNYLDRFSEILNRENPEEKEQGINALKKILHKNLIIKPENIPLDYFLEQEQRIAEQLGHGRLEATPDWEARKTQEILQGQERSLDTWIDYLSSDGAMYPDWAKYWAFRSMTQMGGYNKEEGKFGKRTETSSQPFPTLNIACMAKTIDLVQRHVAITGLPKDDPERQKKEKELSYALNHDSEYKELLSTENFAKLYTHALEQFFGMSFDSLENIAGYWKTYEQDSEPDELYESLQGYPLEWCTATNIETAKSQLKGGDFHVYYSQNNDGVAVIPRLAIRMDQNSIGEVRGIEKNQNVDQFISPILNEKLVEFGKEGEKYLKKSEDMQKMTIITEKHRAGQELNKEDLKFLYEVDGKIQGFGYEEDPRIREVKKGRKELDNFKIFFDPKDNQEEKMLETIIIGCFGEKTEAHKHGAELRIGDIGPRQGGKINLGEYGNLRFTKIIPKFIRNKDSLSNDFLKKLIEVNTLSVIENKEKFNDSSSEQIYEQIITAGKGSYLIEYFKNPNINSLSPVVAQYFLDSSSDFFNKEASLILKNIDRFPAIYFNKKIVSLLIDQYMVDFLMDNLDKCEIPSREIFLEFIKKGKLYLISESDKFSSLPFDQEIVSQLLDNDYDYFLAKNLDRFTPSREIFLELIKKGTSGNFSIDKFPYFPFDQEIVSLMLNNGYASILLENLDRCNIPSKDLCIELINKVPYDLLFNYQEIKDISLNEIADLYIELGKGEIFVHFLKDINNHQKWALKLIESHQYDIFIKNIYEFKDLDYNIIARKLIELKQGKMLARNIRSFKNIDQSLIKYLAREFPQHSKSIEKYISEESL